MTTLRPFIRNLIGHRYGKLTVISYAGMRQGKSRSRPLWNCVCDCGRTAQATSHSLYRGDRTSCGCVMNGRLNPAGLSCVKLKFRTYRRNARKKSLVFDLCVEEFTEIISRPCAYCGVEPEITCNDNSKHKTHHAANGIDRLDSSLGYIPSNLVTACSTCNYAKMDLSVDEFNEWLKRICDYRTMPLTKEIGSGVLSASKGVDCDGGISWLKKLAAA